MRIEGLLVEIGVDAKKFHQGIDAMDKSIGKTKTQLQSVNKALKFNPTSTDLIKQKQQLLGRQIDTTKQKLKTLKDTEDKLKQSDGFDENSEDAKRLRREIIETESKLKSLQKQATKVSTVFGTQMQAAGQKMIALGKSISAVGDRLTMRLTMPLVAMGAMAVKKFAEVDKTMQLTNATMGNTATEAKMISDAMKEAASNSTFGMKDAAQASLNFARAGLTAEQAAAALAPAMNLAAGEGGNLDTVSAGLVATINGFHGSFNDATKYADVFANACNNSALDVDSLAKAMSVAAPVFSAAGYSVDDAALYMGVMANNGIEANKAANSLKTGLARLIKPTDEAAGVMEQLGIQITNSDGSMKDSVTVQKQLHDAFGRLSESEQIAAASAIFGKNQMAPWLALINSAPNDVNSLSRALETEGTTAQMAESMMSGFGGSLEKLKSSIDVAATSFGEALAPTISKVADVVQDAVDAFNDLSDEQKETIARTTLLVAAAGPLLSIGGRMTTGIGHLLKNGGKLVNTIAGVVKGTATLSTTIGVGVGAFGALVAAAYAYSKAGEAAIRKQTDFTKEQKQHFQALEDTADRYKDLQQTRDESVQSINAEYGLIENLKNEYNGLIDSNGQVKAGYEARAEYIKGELASALGIEKGQLEDLISKNGQLTGAIDEVIRTKKAEAIFDANKEVYKEALQNQREAAEKLAPAIADLAQKKEEQAAAEQRYRDAQERAQKAVANGGRPDQQMTAELNQSRSAYEKTTEAINKAEGQVKKYTDTLSKAKADIQAMDSLQKAIADKDQEGLKQAIATWEQGIKTRATASKDELSQQAKTINEQYEAIKKAYNEGELDITKDVVDQAKARRDAADKEAGITRDQEVENAKKTAKDVGKAYGEVSTEAKKNLNPLEQVVSNAFNNAKKTAVSALGITASETSKKTGEARKAATDNSSAARNAVVTNANDARAKAALSFGGIASSASTNASSMANSFVANAAAVKRSFPINLGQLFTGSLPQIFANIGSTTLDFVKRIIPFAKGYTSPMLFTSPTLMFGDRGNSYGGEMVYGRNNLMRDIQYAVAGMGGNTFNITVDGTANPEEFADRLMNQIKLRSRTV